MHGQRESKHTLLYVPTSWLSACTGARVTQATMFNIAKARQEDAKSCESCLPQVCGRQAGVCEHLAGFGAAESCQGAAGHGARAIVLGKAT